MVSTNVLRQLQTQFDLATEVVFLSPLGFGILVQRLTHSMTCAIYGAVLSTSKTWWRGL